MKGLKICTLALTLATLLCSCALVDWIDGFMERFQKDEKPAVSSSEPEPVDPNWPVEMGDVPIEKKPKRVVSLNPSITELVFDMELDSALKGVDDYCSYPEQAKELARCGTEAMPEVEAIADEDAQLVLVLNELPAAQYEALLQADAEVIVLEKPQEIDKLPEYYEQIATIFLGKEDGPKRAKEFAEPLLAAYDEITEAVREADAPRPLGCFMALLPLTMATGDSLQGQLLEACGIENAAAENSDWQYPEDQLLAFNPEVLVFDTRTATLDEVKHHYNYKTTPCVVNERLLAVDGSAIENGGKRLFETVLEMARFANAKLDLPERQRGAAADSRKD